MFAANEKSKKDDITINYEPESGRLHDTLILVAGGTDSAMCPKHFERQQQLGGERAYHKIAIHDNATLYEICLIMK